MKLDEDVGKNSKEFEEEIERRKIGLGGAQDEDSESAALKKNKSKGFTIMSTAGKGKPTIESIHSSKESANTQAKTLLKEAFLASQKKNPSPRDAFNIQSSESAKSLFIGTFKYYSEDVVKTPGSSVEIKVVENDFYGEGEGAAKKAPAKKRQMIWVPATSVKRAK